jgi:hypothetical protein
MLRGHLILWEYYIRIEEKWKLYFQARPWVA